MTVFMSICMLTELQNPTGWNFMKKKSKDVS